MVSFFDARRKPFFHIKAAEAESDRKDQRRHKQNVWQSQVFMCSFFHIESALFDQKAVTPRNETCFWFSRSNSS